MKKVICFARVSTISQDLEPQVKEVKKAIILDGYTEEQIIYVQGKESAIKLDEEQRQTLSEMKELVSDNPNVDSIYFFGVDRLARRMGVVLNVYEWAVDNNINLVFLNPQRMSIFTINEHGEKVVNEGTKMSLVFMAYGAEMEMKIKLARFNTAKKAMKAQGKLPQGKPILGYYLGENRTIIVEPTKAELIRNLFNDYLNGEYESLNSLYNKYLFKGLFEPIKSIYKTAGKTKVWNTLKDCSYCGRTKDIIKKKKDVVIKTNITYPPILSEELYDAVQEKLASRKHAMKYTQNVYYAKGLVRCAECNGLLKVVNSINSYGCKERNHSLHINMNVVDSIVWQNAAEWYKYFMSLDMSKTKEEYTNKIKELKGQLELVDKQINEEFIKQDKAFTKYYQGKVREVIFDKLINESQEKIEKLTKQKTQVELSINEFNRLLESIDNSKPLVPMDLDTLGDLDKLEIIRKVVKVCYVKRLDKYIYDIRVYPTDFIAEVIFDNEFYVYNSKPFNNKLEVNYQVGNEWEVRDITSIINIRHDNKKSKKKTDKGIVKVIQIEDNK